MTGVQAWTRVFWRLQRWEAAVLIGGCLLLTVAMWVVAWQLKVNSEAIAACYEATEARISPHCRSLIDVGNLLSGSIGVLNGAAILAPFGVGIFLGAPLVAREIEHRTAPMAWSLSLSRRRWLAARVLPALGAVGVVLLLLGQASALLVSTAYEDELGFRYYDSVGPIIAARGVAVFGIGVLVGMMVGRVLPALLVTGLATVAVAGAASIGRDQLMRAEAEWIEPGSELDAIAMIYDSRLRDDATGELVTWEEVYASFPPEEVNLEGDGTPPGMTQLYLTVPPERYPSIVAREIAALAGIGAFALGAAWWAVLRRRPE